MLSTKILLFLMWIQKFLMMITIIFGKESGSKSIYNSSIINGELHNEPFSITDFILKIPKECEDVDICENIPDYPQEYVSNIIESLSSKGIYFPQDIMWDKDEKELCRSVPEVIYPRAVRDSQNKWHLALNSEEMPQRIIGKKCETRCSNCSDYIHFLDDYYGTCDQRYMPREVIALDEFMTNVTTVHTLVASCCVCVAKKV